MKLHKLIGGAKPQALETQGVEGADAVQKITTPEALDATEAARPKVALTGSLERVKKLWTFRGPNGSNGSSVLNGTSSSALLKLSPADLRAKVQQLGEVPGSLKGIALRRLEDLNLTAEAGGRVLDRLDNLAKKAPSYQKVASVAQEARERLTALKDSSANSAESLRSEGGKPERKGWGLWSWLSGLSIEPVRQAAGRATNALASQ